MKFTDKFTILGKTTKNGVGNNGEWVIEEYSIKNNLESSNGSTYCTYLTVRKGKAVSEIKVGAVYDLTIFISSSEYNGKFYPKFTITAAKLIKDVVNKDSPDSINTDEDLPF